MTFWNEGTFTRTSSVQGLPVILKWHNLQSLDKALDLFIEIKFCESDFYLQNGSKNCMVATYNFGSVYTVIVLYVFICCSMYKVYKYAQSLQIKYVLTKCLLYCEKC